LKVLDHAVTKWRAFPRASSCYVLHNPLISIQGTSQRSDRLLRNRIAGKLFRPFPNLRLTFLDSLGIRSTPRFLLPSVPETFAI
jgi:hypothetical protein